MKTSRTQQGLSLLACICLAGSALAQEAAPGQAPQAQTEIRAQTQLGAAQAQIGVQGPTILKLGQIQIKDNAGQALGTLEDLVVSPQGCVDMAVLSLGGTRLVPIPWQVVRTEQTTVVGAGPVLTVQVDRTKLMQAPAIERAQLHTQVRQATFLQQVNSFYGVQARSDTTLGGTAQTNQGTNIFGGRFGGTNVVRTNVFPTGRTNLFRTNVFPQPGTRPQTTPPGQQPGQQQPDTYPGRPESQPPGTVPPPQPPGTAPNQPGTPNTP